MNTGWYCCLRFSFFAAKRPEIVRNDQIKQTSRFMCANLKWYKPTLLLKDLPSFIPTQAMQCSQKNPQALIIQF